MTKTFPVWSEKPTQAQVAQAFDYLGMIEKGQPLKDNRCPICLGDLYTCECGKVRR